MKATRQISFPGHGRHGVVSKGGLRILDAVEKHPYVIGDFVWTGMDHLGESGIGHTTYVDDACRLGPGRSRGVMPWPTSINWSGDIDNHGKQETAILLPATWSGTERQESELAVYAPVPEANTSSPASGAGRMNCNPGTGRAARARRCCPRCIAEAHPGAPRAQRPRVGEQGIDPRRINGLLNVPYQPAPARQRARRRNVVATCSCAPAAQRRPRSDCPNCPAGGRAQQLIYVPVEIRDASGPWCRRSRALRTWLTGPPKLKAFGSQPRGAGFAAGCEDETFRGRAWRSFSDGRTRHGTTQP